MSQRQPGTMAGNPAERTDSGPELAGVFPLSPMQESLWLSEQISPGQSAYNLPEAWRLQGPLQLTALQRSLDALVGRQESLRTVFVTRNGKSAQAILTARSLRLPVVDLSGCSEPEPELSRCLAAEARQPFDLARGPLVRIRLFRMGREDHVMAINLHHIIADAWSQGVLLRELTELYRAEITGTAPALRPLAIQYADFAVWLRQRCAADHLQKSFEYWKAQLQGPRPLLALPTDFPRPTCQSYRGAAQFVTLPAELTTGLKELSRRHGTTLFMTLLAAFKVLLHRYTRQTDLVVGSPVAGRDRLETEDLIGLFVHTCALRTSLGGDPAFAELLGRVREVVLGAHAHQEVPLEQLLSLAQPERDLSRHPLFQVVFGFQAAAPEEWSWPGGVRASRIDLDNGGAKFDWTVLITENERGLRLRSEYNTDLFTAETMRRLLGQYQVLLAGVIAAPQKRLLEFPLLNDAERRQVVVDWNRTATAYERHCCVHELFERQAAENPAAVALVCAGKTLTYDQLNRRANRLARRLQARGVGPEVLVGLSLERSPELIVAMLGILKAGGAYVPLDRMYPAARLKFMLEDTGVRVLVTDRRFDGEGLPLEPAQVIRVDSDTTPALPREENPVSGATAENLAYVLYTSGSTGTPKAVAIPHRGVVRLVRNPGYIEFSSRDVWLQLAPISFDASTFEIWGALLNGGRLVLFPPHTPSLEELGHTLQAEKITTLWLTAGLFHQMVEHHLDKLSGVRWLLAGGDVLSVPHVRKVVEGLGGCQLINGYGPTENTTFTCCYRVPARWGGGTTVPIGRPISNTQVFVLDGRLEPVPVGMPGELYAGGDGLARGYLCRPELTAEKFVPNPLAPGDGLMYRTGDLVRWLPDGNLEFLGRIDEQVKIRGFRVEPGEVEAKLAQHPAVAEAAVVPRADASGTKQLVACVVLRARNEATGTQHQPAATERKAVPAENPARARTAGLEDIEQELRDFLAASLPPYLAPSRYVFLPAMPLTPNGKVDRRALPEILPLEVAACDPITPPRTPAETRLRDIWQEVLGIKDLGVHQNFFRLGGHSLLAMQVISRIAREFGAQLPLRAIFEAPTIARLAEIVGRQQRAQPAAIERAVPARAGELLARLGELTDAEVEQLLRDPELNTVLS